MKKSLIDKISHSNFYYGWIIVGVSLISMSFWLGIRNSFSVFYVALLDDFSWSRSSSAGGQSVAFLTYTFLAPLVGALIDRFGPRRVIGPGVVILSLGLVVCSSIRNLAHFYLFYGVLMGTGITTIGIVSYSSVIAHWFEKKRGLASGIAVSGMGLGTFLLVPMSQKFITLWGWRTSFVILGIIVIVILLPLNGIFLRHKPEEMGLLPDGAKEQDRNHSNNKGKILSQGPIPVDWTFKKAVITGRFWALFWFPFLSIIGIYLILVHNVRFMVDQGIDKMTAAMVFAAVGIISSLFRIFWGWLSDRIGREMAYSLGMISGCIGLVSLILFARSNAGMFILTFAVFFGIGWGASAPMFMAVAADLFKGRGFGLIYGIVEGGVGFAGAIGAWIGGYIFDRTQSYQGAFLLCIVTMLMSIVVIWLAAPRKAHTYGNTKTG